MKYCSIKRLSLFLFCFILCFLFNASLSGAEQPGKAPSKKILSGMSLKKIQGTFHSNEILPVVEAISRVRDMASSHDVKVALGERFKAFLSLSQPYVDAVVPRDTSKDYHAVLGFRIELP